MNPEDVLRALSQAATPGPWLSEGRSVIVVPQPNMRWFVASEPADATLIALARNLAEPLADVVSAARAWVDFISGPSNPNYMDHAEEHAGRWETLTAALARLDEKEPQE